MNINFDIEKSPIKKEFIKKPWSDENIGFLLGNMHILKNKEKALSDPDNYKEKSIETFNELDTFLRDNGGTYYENVNDLYNQYNSTTKPLIVRREDPIRIVNLIKGDSIKMEFDPEVVGDRGDKYANSALWPYGPINKTSGIANAFLEGRGAAGPIVIVAGYTHNQDHMKIEDPDEHMAEVGTIQRHAIKILSGEIETQDLEFLIIRAPKKFFDPTKLKLEEQHSEQIFRGYKFK